jgi:hypothetical protein
MKLSRSVRKLVGTFLFVGFLALYALIAMAIGARYLAATHGMWQFLFYVVAGLAWLPGAMLIIGWMAKGDRPET